MSLSRCRILGPLLLATTVSLFAQSTGELTGTVTDASGAAAANAQLRLLNPATGTALSGATNSEGVYRFVALNPGAYTLTVTLSGFAETTLTGIAVEVNRVSRADASLQVASTQQAVEVSASSQMLDFDSSAKGQIIGSRQIRDLPLQSKNPLALMTLTPGVTTANGGAVTNRQGSDGTQISSIFSINGGTRTNNGGFQEMLVDGISVTNLRDGTTSALPAADSIQEFRVQSGGMSSEYGYTVGGVVNYATQGGSNAFHGNLFENHRSTATNARRAIPATAAKPANVFNQFGGTFNGPVRLPKIYDGRNRTFFQFGYEGSRWVRNNPQIATIPTAQMKQGDFSQLSAIIYDPATSATPAGRTPFAGNRIPSARFNPIGKNIVDKFPDPTASGLANNIQGVNRVLTPVDNYTGRLDQNITQNQRIMGRVTWVNSTSDQSWPLGAADQATQLIQFPSRGLAVNYNYSIRPNLLYSAAFGYTKFHRVKLDADGNTLGGNYFGIAVQPTPDALINVRPAANFDIYRAVGSTGPEDQLAKWYQLNQSVSWILGSHTLRFGGDIRRHGAGGRLSGGAPNGAFAFNALQTSMGTAATGNSAASALLGMPASISFNQPPQLSSHKWTTAFYVQDDFRVTPRLTLNLGLRWDYEGSLSEAENRVGYFDSAAVNPTVGVPGLFRYAGLNGAPSTITAPDRNNLSPRVGFTYGIDSSRKTVLRGAFAMYTAPSPTVGGYGAAIGFEPTLAFVAPGTGLPAGILQSSYTLPAASGPLGDAAYLGQGLTAYFDRRLEVPRVYQWNFGLQREIWNNTLVEILYTGNRGLRLLNGFNFNLPAQSLIEEAMGRTLSTGNPGAALAYLNERVPNPLAGKVPGTLGGATVTRAQAAARFPQFAGVSALQNNRDSIYHALQATMQRRLSGDLTFLLSYTFSKQIDNLSAVVRDGNAGGYQNPFNTRADRAVSAFDMPHVFSANLVYALPFGKGKRFSGSSAVNALIGGFQITSVIVANAGMPMAVLQSSANGLGVGGSRPDVIGNPDGLSSSIRGTVAPNGTVRWISPQAYALVNGRYGSAPSRDAHLRGPAFWQVDLGLQRDFKLHERVALRFRAEAFNSLNHTNLQAPDQNLNSPGFGTISAVFDPRIFQFGLELKF